MRNEIVSVAPVCPSCLMVAWDGICTKCGRELGLDKRGTTTTVLAKFLPPEACGVLPPDDVAAVWQDSTTHFSGTIF